MSKSVVYECPKGVYTRIMEGSEGWDLYLESKKDSKAKKKLDTHMKDLHNTYIKFNPVKEVQQ